MKTKTISFKVSKQDRKLISEIAKRAVEMAEDSGVRYNYMDAVMDITATHANGCELDLSALLKADDFNLSHDVFGIRRHINRETGELEGFFVPRFSAR